MPTGFQSGEGVSEAEGFPLGWFEGTGDADGLLQQGADGWRHNTTLDWIDPGSTT